MIINPYIFGGFDPDAQAFITAANITNTTQKNAINTLVVDLKGYGVWTKMKAVYPFVGGTASTHKFNLKDPRDLDVAFRLVFNGGWTHSSTGALPNGTNGFANTYVNILNNLNQNNSHVSVYSRTDNNASTSLIGAYTGGSGFTNSIILYPRISTLGSYVNIFSSGGANTTPATNTLGLKLLNRISSTQFSHFNPTKYTLNITSVVGANLNIYLASNNNSGTAANFSNRETAFATLGDGLTDTEVSNLYIAVQAFQTSLSRQV